MPDIQWMLFASTRVALAALLHDIGKFAERARIPTDTLRLETWKQLDCPHWDGRPTAPAGVEALELPPTNPMPDGTWLCQQECLTR